MVNVNTLNQTSFILSINDIELSKYITNYTIDKYDITTSDTGMNDSGDTIVDYVKKNKVKINIGLTDCPAEYVSKIENAIENGTFKCKYIIGDTQKTETVKAYRGDRKITLSQYRGDMTLWNYEFAVIGL